MKSHTCRRVYRICCLTFILSHKVNLEISSLSLDSNHFYDNLLHYSSLILELENIDSKLVWLVFEFALICKRRYLAMKCVNYLRHCDRNEFKQVRDLYMNCFGHELALSPYNENLPRQNDLNDSFSKALKNLEGELAFNGTISDDILCKFSSYKDNLLACFLK